jgi:hypothetical protein
MTVFNRKNIEDQFQTFILAKCLFTKAEIKLYNYEKKHSFNPPVITHFSKW